MLGNDKSTFQEIADKFNVQIRGAHGEHTETNDHIYDISNKRRLGFSEASLVQDMYNGVNAMIQVELKLAGKEKATSEEVFEYLKDLKLLSGQAMTDKLTAEELKACTEKIAQVEICDSLSGEIATEDDGSTTV